jgi:CheY-like chemotaxis protein
MDREAYQVLAGRRVLIVEDQWLIALELQRIVEQLGCSVIGPAGSVGGALQLLATTAPDAALLDVNVKECYVTPVAEACLGRNIPFALVTGYASLELEEPLLQSAQRVHKPFDCRAIQKVLINQIG